MTTKVDVSPKSIIFAIGTLLLLWGLYQVRGVIVLLFISFILMSALTPLIKITDRFKIPKIFTVLIIYILFILLLTTLIISFVPALIQQSSSLFTQLPAILERFVAFQIDLDFLASQFGSLPSNILRIAVGAFSNILAIFTLLVMTYYLSVERENLHKYFIRFFGNNDAEKKAEGVVRTVERKIGSWIRGQVALMVVVGLMTYVGLLLLGIPYALPLGILAGILEIVPNIGPTIAAIPAILVGLTVSPLTGLGAIALAILVQQLENNLLVPKIMQRAVGINPLISIVLLFVGFSLAGVIGTLLAIPTYLVVSTVIEYIESK